MRFQLRAMLGSRSSVSKGRCAPLVACDAGCRARRSKRAAPSTSFVSMACASRSSAVSSRPYARSVHSLPIRLVANPVSAGHCPRSYPTRRWRHGGVSREAYRRLNRNLVRPDTWFVRNRPTGTQTVSGLSGGDEGLFVGGFEIVDEPVSVSAANSCREQRPETGPRSHQYGTPAGSPAALDATGVRLRRLFGTGS
jgi:hypothetical protein